MNYIIKDDKKLARIYFDNLNEELTLINENFKVIIFFEKKFINQCNLVFLNKFEKIFLTFDKLLDNDLRKISKNLIDDIKLEIEIRKYNNINYSLMDLLINCMNEDIEAMVYYFIKALKKKDYEDYEDYENQEDNKKYIEKLTENVINKIYKILPQDIICILDESNIIRKYYYMNEIFYNLKDYINSKETKEYKISIIYTFTNITKRIEGLIIDNRFLVTEIRSEDGLKTQIEEIKAKMTNQKRNLIYVLTSKYLIQKK